jgi:hypothetical protein
MIVASNRSSLLMSIAVDRVKTWIAGRVVPEGRNVLTAVKDRPVLIR